MPMDRHHNDRMNLSECDPSREAVDQEAREKNCHRDMSKAHDCEEEEDEEEEDDEEEESHRETKNHGSRTVNEEPGFSTAKCGTNGVAAEGELPRWAEMVPDALARIFSHISIQDMLGSIPLVCRSWRRASNDAVCWRRERVDLEDWGHASVAMKQETLEKILVLLVSRSRGCLREIFAPKLSNDDLLRLIAWSGSPIRVLRIPYSLVTEECLCKLAPKFKFVTFLDISGCTFSRACVESFGKHCHLITRLNLNMYPQSSSATPNDDVAFAVAQYMPQLKHLEMAYGVLSNIGLKAMLEKCTNLEHLDLRGCWQLNMEEGFVEQARKQFKVFHAPVVEEDIYNTDDSEFDVSDYYDDSDYYDEDMWFDSDFEEMDDLIMEMHEEEINGTLYFWPDTSPSP